MSYTRTITVVDHEVSVRIVEIPDETPTEAFTALTGGRLTGALTAAGALLVLAVAFMPAITAAFH